MKKVLSLILTFVLALSCLCLPAAALTAEPQVQVTIAPWLYKSTLYPMEFPSHQSYDIKEKSIDGDFAISRELNDLSYRFVFPAGTTKIECKVSLNGESDWRGYTVNSADNPNYWEKNADGEIDYTKPMTFKRDEVLAEQDEYGVLYRDFLKGSNSGGFANYDKIYWRLTYICNGEEYTHSFSVKLYDYDSAAKQSVKTVNFNVAGLPFAALGGTDVAGNQAFAAEYLSENEFDIVAVQEDFGYHSNLVSAMSGFEYLTIHTGSIPGGDGLNVFTKDMPIYNETRVEWNDAYGILDDGSDALTPKGFVYTVIDIGSGVYVDFYNLHADAYGGEGSVAARTSQYKQLAEFIQARSAENDRPVIVAGDFNNHLHAQEDNAALYNTLVVECGMKDAWIEVKNDGDYFNFSKWFATGERSWGNWDSVERYMYRAGGGVDVIADDFRYVNVYDSDGEVISDHAAAECDFTFIKTADFEENTQQLEVIEDNGRDFLYRIKWIFKCIALIFSDIDKLPELLKELGIQ